MGWVLPVVLFVASLVIGYLLRPKMEHTAPNPAGIDDFNMPTATTGKDIPVVFGTCWVNDPNCVWYGDLASEPIMSEGGGKK